MLSRLSRLVSSANRIKIFQNPQPIRFIMTSSSQSLLLTTVEACDSLSSLVSKFYNALSGDAAKLKEDKSVFTIADGLVQELLKTHLFGGNKFKAVVGEEDGSHIDVSKRPFQVDDLVIDEKFYADIEAVRNHLDLLSKNISSDDFKDVTIFIDPIDGTREFYTKMGEQCSICIGFAKNGKPWAGLVYRPLTLPPTWAAGCQSDSFRASKLVIEPVAVRGLLTSNGSISPFIESLMKSLNFKRLKAGGAGNKMLMLLERKGMAYIQDRGVSRWDTCGAQAVIEAHGGILSKLDAFSSKGTIESYTYEKSDINLDINDKASLTKYNAVGDFKDGATATSGDLVKPYSNLCGLFALAREAIEQSVFGSDVDREGALVEWKNRINTAEKENAMSFD